METNLREDMKEYIIKVGAMGGSFLGEHNMVYTPTVEMLLEELETLINEHTNEERRALLQMVNRTLKEDGITDANGEEITFTYWQDREIKL
jgi:hypothetical protein